MGQLVILAGPTGAGKSSQAQLLVQRGWHHISSGELLRADPAMTSVLASGQLAPSSEVEDLVDNALASVPESTPIVLDGFPRTIDEAVWLDEHLSSWGRILVAVVVVDVDDAVVNQRLAARGRSDDSPQAVSEKLAEYREHAEPMFAHYAAAGQLVRLDGSGSIQNVFNELTKVLSA